MKFQVLERNWKKFGYLILLIIVFLIFSFFVSRTFSFYEEHQKFDVIKGKISNQNYDTSFSFFIEDEQKNMKNVSSIPSGKDYTISVVCDKGAIGSWNYEKWAPVVRNLTETRTKCQIIFREMQPTFLEVIKKVSVVSSGDGLYEVHHENSDFTETFSADLSENQISQFGETELRYVGNNPNNYVKFNDEIWRVIGLVNTPDGQRIKIVRSESIGDFSWHSSNIRVNNGNGVNEWRTSKLMNLLNYGFYYQKMSGQCYVDENLVTTSCDFSESGLSIESREMIDMVTWNLGTNGSTVVADISRKDVYQFERSNYGGKNCNDEKYCTDQIARTTTWKGKVGLMYLSDYGYSSRGGNTYDYTSCLNHSFIWSSECKSSSWLVRSQVFMTPISRLDRAFDVWVMGEDGSVNSFDTATSFPIYPVVHLKTEIKVANGDGSLLNPYELVL